MEGMLAKLPHCKLIAKFAIDAVKGFAKSCPKNKAKATSQTYQQKQPSAGSYVHGAKTAKLYQSLAEPTPLAPQMYSFSMCCSMCLQVRCNCQKWHRNWHHAQARLSCKDLTMCQQKCKPGRWLQCTFYGSRSSWKWITTNLELPNLHVPTSLPTALLDLPGALHLWLCTLPTCQPLAGRWAQKENSLRGNLSTPKWLESARAAYIREGSHHGKTYAKQSLLHSKSPGQAPAEKHQACMQGTSVSLHGGCWQLSCTPPGRKSASWYTDRHVELRGQACGPACWLE